MIRMFVSCAVVLVLLVTIVEPKIYKPCELAQELYNTKHGSIRKYLELLVCVAGFHDFNSSSLRVTPDGTHHYGIFGLLKECARIMGYNSTSKGLMPVTEPCRLQTEAENFLDDTMFPDGRIPSSFYGRLCNDRGSTRMIRCHVNGYIMGGYPFKIPTTNTLYDSFQSPDDNTQVVLLNPPMVNTVKDTSLNSVHDVTTQ